jgi:hypothetical protein
MAGKDTSPTRKYKRDEHARRERMHKKRRYGAVCVDPGLLANILVIGTKKGVTVQGLPEDALYMDSGYDYLRKCLVYYYGHESFKPVPMGDTIPTIEVTFTNHDNAK